MKVLSAEFVTSAADAGGIPRAGLPQIALAGRSNVGKSTLINALAGRRIARTSAKPGKTRLANFYVLEVHGGRPEASGALASWRFYLVDLPGYGYSKGGKTALDEFAGVTSAYFGGTGPREAPAGTPGRERAAAGRREDASARRASTGLHRSPGEGGPRGRPVQKASRALLLVVDARHPGLDADLAARDWMDSLDVASVVVATKKDKLSRGAQAAAARELERHMQRPVVMVSAATGEGLDELWKHIVKLANR